MSSYWNIFKAASVGQRFLISILVLQSGCQQLREGSAPKAFGWDQDLAPVTTQPADDHGLWPLIDRGFCKGQKPGSCFSLIMRIPKSELVQDLGLSVLALGSSSRDIRAKLDEACTAAWTEYRQKYLFSSFQPLRQKFAQKVEKMRCVYLFMGQEVAMENTPLVDNEIGLSVRLTKFEILGQSIDAQTSAAAVKMQSKSAQVAFRSVSLFGGKQQQDPWVTAAGIGAAPVLSGMSLDRTVQWKWNRQALLENLEKVTKDPVGTETAFTSFKNLARDQLQTVAGASNPLSGSLMLVGMGYNAFRSVCGEAGQRCSFTNEKTDMTGDVRQSLADLVPSSETNELFRLAVIRTIQTLLDETFQRTDAKQLEATFQLN